MNPLIKINTTNLKSQKNLLAFSAGIDSSALFFLLLENDIDFDIAIVNYGMRTQSDDEQKYAETLAQKFDLICYTRNAPRFENNFEKSARDFRYEFFEDLIDKYEYKNLLTAHQLNDQMEWLLMRFTKGAGVSELLGLQEMSHRPTHNLVRPLLKYTKDELLAYLHLYNHKYFVDETNISPKYERNRFRKDFSDLLIDQYADGIRRSFDYLRYDKEQLELGFEMVYHQKELHIIKLHLASSRAKATDLTLKKLGYLLSSAQREQITKEDSLVIGGKWSIEVQNEYLYISSYVQISMPKKFKERCRSRKIPNKIRAYCFCADIDLDKLSTFTNYWI